MDEKYWDLYTCTLFPKGENEILFTAEYWILVKLQNGFLNCEDIGMALGSQVQGYRWLGSRDPSQTWSHDNHDGFICLSYLTDDIYHHKVFYTDWQYRLHPRDLIFYLWATGGIRGAFFGLLMPISVLLSLWEIFYTSYKIIDGEKVLTTDSKILTWLRMNTLPMPFLKKVSDWYINKKFGGWKNIFAIYFKDPEHPINTLWREYEI